MLMTGFLCAGPDYDEDNPDDNTHTFTVTVSDGTLTQRATDFTLTVTDVTDPPVGSDQKLSVNETTLAERRTPSGWRRIWTAAATSASTSR